MLSCSTMHKLFDRVAEDGRKAEGRSLTKWECPEGGRYLGLVASALTTLVSSTLVMCVSPSQSVINYSHERHRSLPQVPSHGRGTITRHNNYPHVRLTLFIEPPAGLYMQRGMQAERSRVQRVRYRSSRTRYRCRPSSSLLASTRLS